MPLLNLPWWLGYSLDQPDKPNTEVLAAKSANCGTCDIRSIGKTNDLLVDGKEVGGRLAGSGQDPAEDCVVMVSRLKGNYSALRLVRSRRWFIIRPKRSVKTIGTASRSRNKPIKRKDASIEFILASFGLVK